ncbi:MAG: hypothetical protein DHS20C05_18370 [Hyphococcus sp.]|nr:MAG: hypothetical protein DHS20C05_18370 [Marinicaulis sp.]
MRSLLVVFSVIYVFGALYAKSILLGDDAPQAPQGEVYAVEDSQISE